MEKDLARWINLIKWGGTSKDVETRAHHESKSTEQHKQLKKSHKIWALGFKLEIEINGLDSIWQRDGGVHHRLLRRTWRFRPELQVIKSQWYEDRMFSSIF